jgi:hypothetical protein
VMVSPTLVPTDRSLREREQPEQVQSSLAMAQFGGINSGMSTRPERAGDTAKEERHLLPDVAAILQAEVSIAAHISKTLSRDYQAHLGPCK